MNRKKTLVDPNDAAEPTRAQLEILQVLWKNGPSTVRFVNDQLNRQKESLSYTSTLKLMQIMHEKGMVIRDESSMTHVYSAVLEEQKTKGVVLKKFVDSMYNGNVKSLMLELLGNEKTTNKDWDTIKDLLTKLDDQK
ncbi:MAG TPA: BlaI/MecI/CopY family transcriptional regulator [Puia sp.]|jgi:BlaI family penicillinase repressor|nr:BlaI/MecI/CopY family transcriptional regulator [Puia sp.]